MSTLTAVANRRSWWTAAFFLVAGLTVATSAHAQAKACARTATGTWTVTGVVSAGQTLGACSANSNWARVVPLKLTPASAPTGNATAGGTIAFTRSGNHLFVGLTVTEDQDLSDLDQVVLVFDKENDGAANNGDFFLRIDIGPSTPITSANNSSLATCQFTAKVHYYAYSAEGFVEQASNVASATIAKVAYDYDTGGDPETHLWNLEIDMPINPTIDGTTYYPLQTSGTAFAMGAYVFVDQGHQQVGQQGNVLRWPEGMPERQISEWDQNAPAWQPTTLADMQLSDVCFNVTLAATLEPTPWIVNGSNNPDGSAHLNPANENNSFRVRFFYQGPGDAAANGPNKGNVRVTVMPFNGSAFDPAWQPAAVTVNMPQYNQHYTADFFAPANTFPSTMQWACSDLYLEGFTIDDDKTTADNHIHINHNYIHTSEFTQPIALSTSGIPNLSPGQATNLVINIEAGNDLSAMHARNQLFDFDFGRPRGTGWGLVAMGVLSLALAVTLRRRRRLSLGFIAASTLAIAAGCHRTSAGVGNDRWQVENADSLGLVPIDKQPGWYRMPIKHGEIKTLNVHFKDAELPYKTVVESLSMRQVGERPNMKTVPVLPAHIITVVATGLVDVDGKEGPTQPINPAGFSRENILTGITARAAAPQYLLSAAHEIPAQNVGTLIGSFDNLKTSFVIGTNKSIAVPNGAKELTLAINGSPIDYRLGEGAYEINIIDTPGPHVPTSTAVAFDTPLDRPWFVPPWLVLTAMHVKSYYEVPVIDHKTKATQTGLTFLGESNVSIYRSSAQR